MDKDELRRTKLLQIAIGKPWFVLSVDQKECPIVERNSSEFSRVSSGKPISKYDLSKKAARLPVLNGKSLWSLRKERERERERDVWRGTLV
jgi:hypothetical protein